MVNLLKVKQNIKWRRGSSFTFWKVGHFYQTYGSLSS